jgi:deoxyribodipyrimidine photo-lyase
MTTRILWFRRDLRIADNPLLSFDGTVVPIFIFDRNILSGLPSEDRRVGLIYTSVMLLKQQLQDIGLDLKIYYDDPRSVLQRLAAKGITEVVASGDYDAYARERDTNVAGIMRLRYQHDTYLLKPHAVMKPDGSPYRVFTPFYKRARQILDHRDMSAYAPARQHLYPMDYQNYPDLQEMGFQSISVNAACDAQARLRHLIDIAPKYSQQRDCLDQETTSKLSVALRFGWVSVRQVFRALVGVEGGEAMIRQLLFRDFYAYLLFHFPRLAHENYQGKFQGIADNAIFMRFCEGQTGVPVVDAGVRELLDTGLMHNRARMIVASFFTKHLLLPWQWGEQFFAEKLLDYDAASNILSWQWSAGTGIDPQPYFRIFNPYTQSKKFDPDGRYIKRHVPELAKLDAKAIHDEHYLAHANITNYPRPMVDHRQARERALSAFGQ